MAEPEITPTIFFEQLLPAGFEGDKAINPNPEDFTLQYHVGGPGGGDWSVRIEGGKMIVERSVAPAILTLTISAQDLVDALSSANGAAPSLVLPRARKPGQSSGPVKALRGTMALNLTRGQGVEPFRLEMKFNGAATPRTVMTMAIADYVAMGEGRLNGQEAFMTGKMRVEGDMAFLMQVGMATAN
ncbi:MAG TPA: SCP2 sterol-binding domain-containing protein [Candidatus Bathyarchaeia archaeon]|nr:SCP2 sterol-binding domain-containing protein [Candidatus Bathyarchaeia archaeon]